MTTHRLSPYVAVSDDESKGEGAYMSLFMDVHTIDGGVAVKDVAAAHMADLDTQQK